MTMTKLYEDILWAILLGAIIYGLVQIAGCGGVDVVGPTDMGEGATFAPEIENTTNNTFHWLLALLGTILLFLGYLWWDKAYGRFGRR